MTSLMTSFVRHPFLALMIFLAGYFMTISVRANAQDTIVTGDAIQLQDDDSALITGRIIEVKDQYFDMESSGKVLRVSTRKVDLGASADSVLVKGMHVSVRGEMKREEFGRMLVDAESVVASASPSATVIEDNTRNNPN